MGFLQRQSQQNFAGRFRRSETRLLSGKIRHFLDPGFGIRDERDFSDMAAGAVDDDNVDAGARGRKRGGGRNLAIGQIAGQHVA